MGIVAFVLSILAAIMSFFEPLRMIAFIFGIFAIIFGIISGYIKEQKKDEDKNKKKSMAIEIGAIIISGAVCVSYLIILCIT